MHTGIKDALDQKIEKQSPTLGRSAVYTQKSRISRLPSNLVVHMVRFYWRRDINKKAKIMVSVPLSCPKPRISHVAAQSQVPLRV